MDARATGVLAYITWVGWLIAFCIGDREKAKFHLNQSLVLLLFSLLSVIPCIGWLWAIFIFVCWVIALLGAINGEEKEVPLIGHFRILK